MVESRRDTSFPRPDEGLSWRFAMAAVVALTTGCDSTPAGDDDAAQIDGGADRDAAGETDASADGGAEPDGGGQERVGMAGRSGNGTGTADGYAGTEEVFFIGEEGQGETICRITYSLTSTDTPADGCDGCLWAFELVITDALVAEERDVGCLATVGIDPAHVEDLDGSRVSYGYDPEYLGHGSVLMSRTLDDLWAPECFATWDEASGAFSYRRIDGFPSY